MQFLIESQRMLESADIQFSRADVELLAADLRAVAEEFPSLGDECDAPHAARVLRHRIGGLERLESYMRCLRVPAVKSLTSRVRDGKLSTTEPEGK